MRLRGTLPLLLLAALAACGRADEDANEAVSNDIVNGAEVNVSEAPNGTEPAPAADPPLDELAGVKVGATVAQLRAQGFTVEKDAGPDLGNTCGYARIAGMDDLFFMLDGDNVVRIEVATPGHPTLGGVEVGMSEAEALRRLGPRAKVEPHKYTGPTGHYLVVHDGNDPLGLIFETDGKKVLSYRFGRWEQVQWVEGCA